MKMFERPQTVFSRLHEVIFYQPRYKIQAREIINQVAINAQRHIDLQILTIEKLQEIEADPEFEKTYQKLWKYIVKPEFESKFGLLTIVEQDAIGLRHAEYLRRRWFPDESQIILDFTQDPKISSSKID